MGNSSRALRLSCEYFPPKTEDGKHKLLAAHDKLQALKPEFFSVTYGAGGSTRSNTRDMVLELKRRGSCVALNRRAQELRGQDVRSQFLRGPFSPPRDAPLWNAPCGE